MSTLLDKWRMMAAIVASPTLTDLDRRVAFRLLDRFDPARDGAWPSYETLGRELQVTTRAVISAVSRLVDQGWFKRTRNGGRGRSNVYRPAWERVNTETVFGETLNGQTLNRDDGNSEPPRQKTVNGRSPDSFYESLLETDTRARTRAKAPAKPYHREKRDNLASLTAFVPDETLLGRLRKKAPTVAPFLSNLADDFRTSPYWRREFEKGSYSDPAACFENFVIREERREQQRQSRTKESAGNDVVAETTRQYRELGVL